MISTTFILLLLFMFFVLWWGLCCIIAELEKIAESLEKTRKGETDD